MTTITARELIATAVLLVDGQPTHNIALYREDTGDLAWYGRHNRRPLLQCNSGTASTSSALHQVRYWAGKALGGDGTRADVDLIYCADHHGYELYEPRDEWSRDGDTTVKVRRLAR